MLTAAASLFALLLLVLSGCGGGPGPQATAAATPTPRQIADQSAAAMGQVKSAHFVLTIEGQPAPTALGFQVSGAEGDAVAPDRLRAKIKARMGQGAVDTEIVVVGPDRFLKNPLNGKFEPLTVPIGSFAMLDKGRGAAHLLATLKDPTAGSRETVAGVDSDVLSGTVAAADLTALFGGQPVTDPVKTQVWIAASDRLVRQVRFSGPIAQGEPEAIVRTIVLGPYNQDVSIDRPG